MATNILKKHTHENKMAKQTHKKGKEHNAHTNKQQQAKKQTNKQT